ncbi:MAG: hypothetical protein IRZ04_10375 [Rhodospirillales bacterium]|nr:hypothetical protein [Rhodospirillales bacterium]
MGDPLTVLVLFGLLLALAVPYVGRIRHPASKPLAAYAIFVVVFSVASVLLFLVLWQIAEALGMAPMFKDAPGALLFLALVFVPAFLAASWQARKPPQRMPRQD